MNFCGGGVEHQVNEPPILAMAQHGRPSDEDFLGNTSSSHRGSYNQVDLSVHPTCAVKSSTPQSNGLVRNEILRINKKKLQQPQQSHPTHTLQETSRTLSNSNATNSNSRSRARSRPSPRGLEAKKSSLEERMRGMEINLPSSDSNQRQNRGIVPRKVNSPFSNMKTLDTLLKRLESGFRVVSIIVYLKKYACNGILPEN
jgi:hypothetical protein